MYKFDQIKSGDGFQNTGRKNGKNSGAIKHPGKTWFLKLAASSARAVNLIRDKDGISYARKAMIRCGLSLDVTGQWHTGQLSSELQTIIKKNRKFFEGSVVPPFGSSAADRDPAHYET
jgi:hypothetical protein